MWKSDGTEQKFLEKLFREKLITVDMKPGDVQKRFSMFRSHSAPVFRKHFTLTRQMFNDNSKHLFVLNREMKFAIFI